MVGAIIPVTQILSPMKVKKKKKIVNKKVERATRLAQWPLSGNHLDLPERELLGVFHTLTRLSWTLLV